MHAHTDANAATPACNRRRCPLCFIWPLFRFRRRFPVISIVIATAISSAVAVQDGCVVFGLGTLGDGGGNDYMKSDDGSESEPEPGQLEEVCCPIFEEREREADDVDADKDDEHERADSDHNTFALETCKVGRGVIAADGDVEEKLPREE